MITQNDLMECIPAGIVMLLLISMSIILLRGKGAWFIAGYNVLTRSEKEQYDTPALCKFVGKYLLSVSLLLPAPVIGGIFKIYWLIAAYGLYVLISGIFAVAYCNTGNRFKK